MCGDRGHDDVDYLLVAQKVPDTIGGDEGEAHRAREAHVTKPGHGRDRISLVEGGVAQGASDLETALGLGHKDMSRHRVDSGAAPFGDKSQALELIRGVVVTRERHRHGSAAGCRLDSEDGTRVAHPCDKQPSRVQHQRRRGRAALLGQ